jgi:ribosomal protein S18 acetylase RimI-like enzyme
MDIIAPRIAPKPSDAGLKKKNIALSRPSITNHCERNKPHPASYGLKRLGNENVPRILASASSEATTTPAPAADTTETASPSGRFTPSNFQYFSPDHRWKVRLVAKDDAQEVRAIVRLQADGFHTSNPIPFVDAALKTFFTAEVLSEMQKKLQYNPEDKFVCLVVEPANPSADNASERTNADTGICGVVEVSYIDEKEVLQSLEPGTKAFCYIASMAVGSRSRRQGVASTLLAAAEAVACMWGEKQAALHVYQDNQPAIALYRAGGYEIIHQDAPWLAKVAVRPRYLMRKKFD